MKEQKDIYDLTIHESTTLSCGICILRVPGGWIYDMWDFSNDCAKQGLFVRFDNEFQRASEFAEKMFQLNIKAEQSRLLGSKD